MKKGIPHDIAEQGGRIWKAYDYLTIELLDCPRNNSFVDAQNSAMSFVANKPHPRMLCQQP